MARIFEALTRMQSVTASGPVEPTRGAEVPATSIVRVAPVPSAPVKAEPSNATVPAPEPAASTTELPYIEVGSGPITGSVSVMSTAAPVQPAVKETPVAEGTIVLHEIGGVELRQPLSSRLAPGLVAYHQPEHDAARQYRTLLTSVLSNLDETENGQGRVLLFSGLAPTSATTTVVLNLALTQARAAAPRRGVIVDAATATTGVHRLLGMTASPGLSEVIAGAVPVHRAVRDTGIPYCQVLCAGETGKPCLAVKSVLATLGQLRKRFDLVFVEAPTCQGQPGLIELAAACDAMYLVAPRGPSFAEQARSYADTLPRLGVPLRGCIVTQ